MKLKCFLILFFLIFHVLTFSQSKQFRHITTENGLSQSEIYCFLEDSRGFMWFGTLDGLNRSDGYNITVFNTEKNNPNSISNNTVRSLAEDSLGRVWIGTDDGLSVYSPKSDKIQQIELTSFQKELLSIKAILINENRILLGTSLGFLRANIESVNLFDIGENFTQIQLNDKNLKNVVALEGAEDGTVWVATENNIHHLVFQVNATSPILIDTINFTDSLDEKAKYIGVRSIKEDTFGNLWVASHKKGVFRYNSSTKMLSHFTENKSDSNFCSDKCSSVVIDKVGDLWIGTRDKGVIVLESGNLNDENPPFKNIQNSKSNSRSLNSNLIYSLYVSKNNLVWIGTVGSGVNIYNPHQKQFNYYSAKNQSTEDVSESNFVRALYADINDNIFVGKHNDGLYLLNRKENIFRKIGFKTESIYYIGPANDNNLFVCSEFGIYLVQYSNNELKILSKFYNDAVFNIKRVAENIYWVATFKGLKKCKILNNQIILDKEYSTSTTPRISFNNCRDLFFAKKTNELYVGTEGGGLNILKLDKNSNAINISIYKKGTSSNSLSNNYIRSIIKDKQDNMWIGTYEGLNKIQRDSNSGKLSFKVFNKKDGLPNNMIQSIVEDNDSNLWIGTNQGLSKFNPTTEKYYNYFISDGIQSNEFSEHTVFKKSDGEIIIGGINGINTFYPNNIYSDKIQAETEITDFFLFNKKVKIGNEVTKNNVLIENITLTDSIFLAPNQNNFGFGFSAMLFSNPDKIKYAYTLEGFDENWQYTNALNRRATYTNLPFGKYTFKVKSTNYDGIWEETPRSVYVHIRTPFFKTPLAYILYVLIFGIIVFYLTKYSVIRYTTKKEILLENELNKKLHEVDQLRARFFVNVSHDLRTPLTLISSPLEIILESTDLKPDLKNQLNRIKLNVKKLKHIIDQLLDVRRADAGKLSPILKYNNIIDLIKEEVKYFETELSRKQIDLNISSSEAIINTSYDNDMISKVIFNIISNAVKYTNEGEINIYIERVTNNLPQELQAKSVMEFVKIDIQDSGIGIFESDINKVFDRFYQANIVDSGGYGIGLSLCKDLIEAHSGAIKVTSKKDYGTTVSIFIPNIKMQSPNTDEIYIIEDIKNKKNIEYTNDNQEQSFSKKEHKVLLVEDNTDMRIFIKDELKNKYQVFEAEDGQEGIKMAKKYSPDLIVSDIMMPNMDGIEFCKFIKSNIETSHIPVILLTAKVDVQTKYNGIEMGADDYISKPFDMQYLLIRIKNIITTRVQLRKLFQLDNTLEPSAITFTSLDEKFMSSLIKALEEGISDSSFSINSLESQLGMSHTNFYRKVKRLTGQSCKDILLTMRMKRAKQILIDNKGVRVSEVAFMVGFSNPKYFSKSFKEFHGQLPTTIKN
ncbi:hybrid sensor histidine kinase/response regulator transcription factor [Zobellia uliginosa]|uniref:hybrid sensor histidine kinase/response regulator transcription factor n=1 Tax=Zobellia uliginosa TaxID=143224 RepID=UPI001C072E12|nr:two-component regulator propeller domain-containing protein [Zobellia uliginosa]MBU2945740.1 response regulator [Zobellia uliginosa]